jgi:aspartate aminotransferase/aminotransferase
MTDIVPRIKEIQGSGIRQIMTLAFQKPSVIRLEVGEPDFDTPEHIVEAGCRALREGMTRYIPNMGLPPLRQAIARFFETSTGVPTTSDQILVTHGAILSLATTWHLLIDEGDEVLIPDPGWPNYSMLTKLLKGIPIHYQLSPEAGFQPDIAHIESQVGPRTKMLVLCSPSNPTGQVYSEAVVRDILQLAREKNFCVVSDEIYSNIVFEGAHVSALPFDTDNRTIMVHGVSKSYAMTGFRVGFLRATPDFVVQGTKMQEALVSCGTASSQAAALAALKGPQGCIAEMRNIYRKRRDLACDGLTRQGLNFWRPQGAFYLLIDIESTGMDGQEFALKLLDEKDVAVAPGPTFGEISRNMIRISLASSDENIRTGIERIAEMVNQTG